MIDFIIYIKENFSEFYKEYNENRSKIKETLDEMMFRDQDIVSYKTSRGIPISLRPEVYKLYSQNEDVNFYELKELKEQHE